MYIEKSVLHHILCFLMKSALQNACKALFCALFEKKALVKLLKIV